MQKAIFKSGSLFPVPEVPAPQNMTITNFGGPDNRHKWEARGAYLKSVLPVPSEHHSSFEEGREYEEGLDYKKQYQVNGLGDTWIEAIAWIYDAAVPACRRIVALPISKREEVEESCGICGSKKVFIRGKYPKMPQRLICPCCAYERLEQISEISNPNYGKVYSESLTPLSQNTPSTGAINDKL